MIFEQVEEKSGLITRGRMQTDDRRLTERAKRRVKALENEFELVSD